MPLYMVFDTEADAASASAAITSEMGLGQPGMVTERWNHHRQRLDAKWVLLWPGNEWLETVAVPFIIEADDESWWPAASP
jgi:hypothetical protein